jgi:PmbA protein
MTAAHLDQCQKLAIRIVAAAKRAGADACDATVGAGSSLSASARNGAIEDLTRATSRAAGLRVIVGGRLGFATAADAPQSARDIDELARLAVELAKLSTASEHNVIPHVPAADQTDADALQTWDDATAEVQPSWAIEQALTMERALSAHAGIDGVRDVSAGARRGVFALSTSTGFAGAWRGTSASISCSGVVEEAGGKKQVEGHWAASRRVSDLPAPDSVALEAARRVLARKGARKIETMRAPVIFDPSMARGFFSSILHALCGDMLVRQQSFLAGKRGSVVLSAGCELVDDPLLPGGFASRPFDGEGLITPRLSIIDRCGRVTTYLHDARSAARMGEAPTGHAGRSAASLPAPAPTNTSVLGGSGDLASIIKGTDRCLLVTRTLGRAPDMVTGDYSRGAAGFLIVDGEIAFAVEEVTIASNMHEMMSGLDRIGADLDERAALRAPTIRFAEMQLSGK